MGAQRTAATLAVRAVVEKNMNMTEYIAQLERTQKKNDELKSELDENARKLKALKKIMARGKQVAKMTDEDFKQIAGIPPETQDAKPPPEYFHLKKETAMKSNQVAKMRTLWWERHKEFEFLLEKARRVSFRKQFKSPMEASKAAELPYWVSNLMNEDVDEDPAVTNGGLRQSPERSERFSPDVLTAEKAFAAGWSLHSSTSVQQAVDSPPRNQYSAASRRSSVSSVGSVKMMPSRKASNGSLNPDENHDPNEQFANVRKSLAELVADSDGDDSSNSSDS